MIDLGRVGLIPKGQWSATTQYEVLDVVYYENATYIAKKTTLGNIPSNDSAFWQFACSMPPGDNFVYRDTKATSSQLGIVKPDGATITVDENGVLSGAQATVSAIGMSMPDDSTIGITSNGTLNIKAEYTRQILNSIGGKADSLNLDEDTLDLQLLAGDIVIDSVPLRGFKGETYELTENDKNEIAQLAIGTYILSPADVSRIADAYELPEGKEAEIAGMVTLSDSDIDRIADAYELSETEKNEIAVKVRQLIGSADTTDF